MYTFEILCTIKMYTVFKGFKNGAYIGYIDYGMDIGSCFYDFWS